MKSARHLRLCRLSSTSVLALSLACGFSAVAHADSVYWSGAAGNNDWFDNSNWVWGGHTPAAGDTAQIDGTGVLIDGAGGYAGNLLVGISSTADLTVQDDLTTTSVSLGWNAGSQGTITVTGSGNVWNNSSSITVGNDGTGFINILDGAEVASGSFYIGGGPTGTGTVTLQDNSKLFATGDLYVGYGGDPVDGADGHLYIYSGSDATSVNGVIADGLNTTGAVLVDGVGSTWNNVSLLMVGGGGVGTLDIVNGGYVHSGSATIANLATASGSTVTVDGVGSEWSIDTSLVVGGSTEGHLDITNGGVVGASTAALGYASGGNGHVSVAGANSSWTVTNDLYVGLDGTGDVSIEASGLVEAGAVYLGYASAAVGAITVDDAVLNVTDRIGVGYDGTGTLTVRDGGTVHSDGAILGWNATGQGTASVSGTGSRWENTDTLYVGNLGDGFLTIAAGGVVTSTDGYVGTENGSDSEATVTGAGSSWEMSGAFLVGHNTGSQGTVTVSAGGSISALQGILGDLAGSVGTMTVTGAGSTWSALVDSSVLYSGDLNVGRFGTGYLTVSDGGSVIGNRLHIGNEAGSSGTVVVSGAGSNLTIAGRLSVGIEGDGVLTVANGATVSADRIVIADDAASSGTINIGAARGQSASAAGTIDSATVVFGDGDGEIVFNHTGSSYAFASDVEGAGTLSFLSGLTLLTGDYSAFTGDLSIEGGLVSVNSSTLTAVANVLSGATLGGSGTLGNVAVASGGTVAPGNSIGTLTVANISFASGSIYSVEIDNTGRSDLLHATGTATISSGASVYFGPENGTDDGSTYSVGTVYTILTADGGVSGTFGSISDGFVFLDGTLVYDANNIYLTLSRNNTSFASLGQTRNQIAVGTALDSMASGDPVQSVVAGLGESAVRPAYDALSGEIHASAKGMLVDDSRFVRDGLNARLLAGETTGERGFWMSSFGSWAKADGDGNAASLEHNIGGFLGGADTVLLDDWRLGFAGGYSRTSFDVDGRNSSGTSDNYSLGVYGGRSLGAFDLRFGGAYTWHRISTDRSVDIGSFSEDLDADYNASTAQFFGEASYGIDTGIGHFSPFAGLAHVLLHTDDMSETGGDAAISAAGDDYAVTYSTLGLRASTPIELGGTAIGLQGMVGWRHAFGDATTTSEHAFATGDAFTVAGTPIARDVAVFEAGLSVSLSKTATFGVSYAGQAGGGDWEQQLKGRFDVRF
ncbi:autotransporter domain-containing protein [Rhizobium cremeum]|uniref:autotransporter domain-containing protein n=1 Tax=Rhizobium cremeum TaxID=2813827 RepID=UPI001FCFEA61|nr:autotransporter domain-containing protein [Rhizobium cremeum]MCJ7998971.1 autotransporter domain-containing protein [Rhizobium cremeum]